LRSKPQQTRDAGLKTAAKAAVSGFGRQPDKRSNDHKVDIGTLLAPIIIT
jgi:hypothetical protein